MTVGVIRAGVIVLVSTALALGVARPSHAESAPDPDSLRLSFVDPVHSI